MGKSGKQKKHWKAKQARAELTLWRDSGQTMAAFSRQRGYSANRLSWWKGELPRRGEPAFETEAASAEGDTAETAAGQILEATVLGISRGAAAAVVETGLGVRIEVADTERVSPLWVAAVAGQLSREGC